MPPHPRLNRRRTVRDALVSRPTGAAPAGRAGRAVVALVAALAVLLAGCTGPKNQTSDGIAPPPPEDVQAGAEPFYEQSLTWEDCAGGFECATATMPLSWDDPQEDEAIEIALSRLPARSGNPIGSLLVNPGGPGASGIELLRLSNDRFGAALKDNFDLVGFDPRGVGASSAVDCGPAEVVDSVLVTDITLESQEDVEVARKIAREFGEECAQRTGDLLGHVETVSAARDMDVLRAVLGDTHLFYLGYSYGTVLGATYAELFPERVGRLVLDGALEPGMSSDELSLEQAEGFENALRAYVTDCQAGADCPLRGSVDEGMEQVARLIARAEEQPIPAGGEQVNGTLAFYGVVTPLYNQRFWPLLTRALGDAIREDDASLLLQLANSYLGRAPNGEYYNNSMVAFTAINCLDLPTTTRSYEEMVQFAEKVAEVAPTFHDFFAFSVGCEAWPYEPKGRPGPVTAAGAAPILVIGTTNDPATPYAWSVALADQLESGHLITYEGEGHTAYGQANSCVHDAVEAYLVDGELPEEGLTC